MRHETLPSDEGSAVWAVLQNGDPPPRPRPVAAAAPNPPSKRPAASPPQPGRAKTIGLAAGVIVLVLAVAAGIVFGYLLPRRQTLSQAEASFQAAARAYTQAQIDLTSQISSTKDAAAAVTAADVKDPATIDAVASALDDAAALSAPAPAMASTAEEINNQVAEMTASTQAVVAAQQVLQTVVAALQQSRVDKASDDLAGAVAAAQKVYDDSAWLGDTAERTALQTLIGQAGAAASAPDGLASGTGAVIAALQAFVPLLQSADDAVNTAVQSATDATYTYVLTGDQLACGVNTCYDGSMGGDPFNAQSASITVQGSVVTVRLCLTSQIAVDPQTCTPTGDDTPAMYGWSDLWTGARNGVTAKVQSTQSAFDWAVVTFDGTAPNSAAVSVTTGDNCQMANGSYGQSDDYGRCA